MVEKILANFDKVDLWKLVGATLFFFLLFSFRHQVGEKQRSLLQVDYFTQDQASDLSWQTQEHGSAVDSEQFLAYLCQQKPHYCQKIIYSGDFSSLDKFEYTSQYFTILSFLDEHKKFWLPVESALKTFIINSQKGKRRWGATASRITINLDSMGEKSEYRGVLTHEFGHIVDLGSLQGTQKNKNPDFTEFGKPKFATDDPSLEYYRFSRNSETIRKNIAQKKDFCSWYGMSNPFEDFAECHNLYLNNAHLFRQMAQESNIMKNKYNFFANLFGNAKLQDNGAKLLYAQRRPRDTTVI